MMWLVGAVVVAAVGCLLLIGWRTLVRLEALTQQLTTVTAVLVRTHLRMQSLDRVLRGSDMPDDATLEKEA